MKEDNWFDIDADEREASEASSARQCVFPLSLDLEFDESLLGFIARVGEENSRREISAVTRIVGLKPRVSLVPFSCFDVQPLAALIGISVQQLDCRLYSPLDFAGEDISWVKFFHEGAPRRAVSARRRRFAPASWQKKPYHRALWDLKPIPCCLETGQMLVERCSCGSRLQWRLTSLIRCGRASCRVDLRDLESAFIEPQVLSKLQFFADFFSPDEAAWTRARSRIPTDLADLSGAEILGLSVFFGLVRSDPSGGAVFGRRRRQCATGNFSEWSAGDLAAGLEVVLGWPQSLYDLADLCSAFGVERPTNFGFRKHLGPLVTAFPEVAFTQRVRNILNDEFRRYFELRPNLRLSSNNSRSIRNMAAGTINLNAAAKEYHISPAVLSRLQTYPELVAYEGRTGVSILFKVDALVELMERYRDSITCRSAVQEYGIPYRTLLRLADEALIARLSGPEMVLHAQSKIVFRRSSIDQFIKQIEDTSRREGVGLCLGLAVRQHSITDPWFEILIALASGNLGLCGIDYSSQRVSSRFRVDHNDVREFLLEKLNPNDKRITVQHAAAEMKMDIAALAELIDISSIPTSTRPYATISYCDFRKLTETYISGAEFAARLNLSPRSAWRYISKCGVKPAVRLSQSRRVIYYRHALEPCIIRVANET